MTEETEQETRKRRIDHKLEAIGWKLIKYHESKHLSSYLSHAIEEYPTSNGPVDYALVDQGQIIAVVEAKKLGTGPQNVLVIIFVIAFGIAQPFLWYGLFEKDPPTGVIDIANLLLILITLLAVGLTGFSVLIYESLQERLSTRITQGIKQTEDEVHKRIKEDLNKAHRTEDEVHKRIEKHVNEVSRREGELSQRTENEIENRQNLFRAQMLRSTGFTFWQLFVVWEEVKVEKSTQDIHTKKIFEDLIRIAIEKAKGSLHYAKKLSENEYKEDIYRCKSNWVYFLAEAARVEEFNKPTRRDKVLALKCSNEILKEVSKKDFQDYYHYWESCAWALQHLSEKEDEKSKQKAHNIICELLNDKDILLLSPSWHGEIENKWADFLEEKNDASASIKNT
ncbi:MAG: hypothetical protein GQ523_06385 [Methanophagales archaeon]|nr:hypothetical protein [Methanophagales archaeon]